MLLSIALGAVIGVVAALTGAGGGMLGVPLLVFAMHLTLVQAGPIELMATGASAGLGAILAHRHGLVRYRAAVLMAIAGMALAPAGIWVTGLIPSRPFTILFALVLLYVVYRTFMKTRPDPAIDRSAPKPCTLDQSVGRLIWTVPCARVLAGSGVAAGFLSGLIGVGGGFVIVPTLQRYTNLETHTIVPTSLAVIALISVAGVLSSSLSGTLVWSIAFPFSGGALLGMLGRRTLGTKLSDAILQKRVAALCVLVAVGLVLRSVFCILYSRRLHICYRKCCLSGFAVGLRARIRVSRCIFF